MRIKKISAFREQGFGVLLPFLLFGVRGGFFGGIVFEDVGEEKTGEGFDNVVGDFFFGHVAFQVVAYPVVELFGYLRYRPAV